jgi:hypothetical protein
MISRREFIRKTTIGSTVALMPNFVFSRDNKQSEFPLVDYHVHLTEDFTIDKAVELSQKRRIKFGIVEHPGNHSPIKTDSDLNAYISKLRKYPVVVGLQPMYLNWSKNFSKELLGKVDYILMDADTIPLKDDKYLSIWKHNNYIANIDEFMILYMRHIENILKFEPINIFARPTYLPVNFGRYYDKLWTKERMLKIVELAKQNNIAMEISTPMHVPSKEFITLAKSEGLKFTFGTNARNNDAGKFHYGLQMVKECELTKEDMFQLE